MTLTLNACAKLNLYLDITGRRSDGYHLLETVMQSVSLSDIVTLSVTVGSGISVSCSDPLIPCGEKNIAYRAAALFLEACGIERHVEIDIQKRIPSGAGMGGGSADAAAVLRGLDRALGAPLDTGRLYEIALQCGADVPFCLYGGTRICRGIGEELSSCCEVSGCAFLVVMPDFTCPTGEAYRKYDSAPVAARGMLTQFVRDVECGCFASCMYNVFEELYGDERISDIRRTLTDAEACGAALTGSGAAVFGVFDGEAAASEAAKLFPTYFTSVCVPMKESIIILT